MCDTFVALGPATRGGVTLFGKNSDREPDEAQNIEFHPPGRDEMSERVLNHVSIPPAGERNGVFLCRPYWMFGAEMGANDKGMVIGNEAPKNLKKIKVERKSVYCSRISWHLKAMFLTPKRPF